MTDNENAEDDRRVGRRSRVLKIVGLTLAGALVLGVGAAGWAYWHLNNNIKSVDIDSALGDDRPAKSMTTPDGSVSASPLPTEALNILVLGSDSREGEENQDRDDFFHALFMAPKGHDLHDLPGHVRAAPGRLASIHVERLELRPSPPAVSLAARNEPGKAG